MFSGIECTSVALRPLGFDPICFAEIEKFPSAVLAYRHPEVTNVGDMTAHDWSQYRGKCDLVVGGPPCQAFSVAGLRQSLQDHRGNLSLAYAAAIDAIDPEWVITENVPGWLSTSDNAFGCFLGAIVGADSPLIPARGQRWTDAGVVTGSRRTAAWRILDAQYFKLAQRRRRVFIVAVRGTGNRRAPEALFPVECRLQGDHPPRRKTGQGFTHDVAPCIGASGRGFERTGDTRGQDCLVSGAISSKWAKGTGGPAGDECYNLVTHSLRADGFDASEDGTGRGTPIVPAIVANGDAHSGFRDEHGLVPIAIRTAQTSSNGWGIGTDEQAYTLDGAQGQAVAFTQNQAGDVMHSLGTNQNATGRNAANISTGMAVRRLTPLECERLMGLPDKYTLVPFNGKPASDGPRYKAIGNGMAVPVIAWIGKRIQEVESGVRD